MKYLGKKDMKKEITGQTQMSDVLIVIYKNCGLECMRDVQTVVPVISLTDVFPCHHKKIRCDMKNTYHGYND